MSQTGREPTFVVCGCGPSLLDLPRPERHTTIGVNDVGRLFDPTYLVVVNPRRQFKADRFKYVEQSNATALYTQLDLGPVRPAVRRFKLGQYGGTEFRDASVLHYTQNSPYVAVCLAAALGARRIGLIGVDFTDDHFFAATGPHPLVKQLGVIDAQYGRLAAALAQRGIELVNLSARSRLTSLRKVGLSWLDGEQASQATAAEPSREPLRIVSYATTPVAGVPELLARCIDAATEHSAQCVWAGGSYGNGVAFAGGVCWGGRPREVTGLLEAADVVIVHNGKVDPAHARVLQGKPLLTMAHNYGWNVDMQHVRRGMPGVVVGQYQATLPEFAGWGLVPNPVPLWEAAHAAGAKGETIHIAYTPSGRHERYPPGHRLYWHGKGWDSTMAVLSRLARLPNVRIETTAQGQVSHEQALAMKRRAHIVVDECVTGSYHRNSLEGLAAGAVVVNGVGLLPGVEQALRRCAPDAQDLPFVCSHLEDLEQTLLQLMAAGPTGLAAQGRTGRAWMERHWDFAAQWHRHWWPSVEAALAAGGRPLQRPAAREWSSLDSIKEAGMETSSSGTVSVVIPHQGAERLPQLQASLRALSAAEGVLEVIVVESGAAPLAGAVCAAAKARHVLVRGTGPFERGRLLNVGTAHAQGAFVLWHDNDLLLDADFIARAVSELQARQLDALLPYRAIRYLGTGPSEAVMAGALQPAAAPADKTLLGGTDVSGGLALMRRSFVEREGGVPEGFKGWGGEDNAWAHKAALLGRYGQSQDERQVVHHLHHADSGAHAGTPQQHADYAANLALLKRQRAVRSAAAYRRQFPPQAPEFGVEGPVAATAADGAPPVRNVFACLVHESPECVVDLVRNLRHFDPASRIVLYDGSQGGHLLDPRLPWAEWGATLHPAPRPMQWGSLHGFALDCIRLLNDGPAYDTLTIVDSDQLLLRPGYSAFLATRLATLNGVGVLSNRPARQDAGTPIAPARAAQQELALWRPWLDRFGEAGVQKWVHWSFWPATVITAAAGRAVLELFERDALFTATLAASKMWATEEVLFPTLAALLGLRVERNPCNDRWVQFRTRHDLRALQLARATPDAFWMHPVPRSYGDPVRNAIRRSAQDYRCLAPARAPAGPPADPWPPILRTMRAIEGWLEDDEAALLARTAQEVLARPGSYGRLVEVGSYCGKATFLLAQAARLSGRAAQGATVIAVDTFDGTVGALDSGVERKGDTRGRFEAMLRAHDLGEFVQVRVGRANAMQFSEPVDLLLVDGLHDYASAALDFHAVAGALAQDAVVVFHDCADYFPGVVTLVEELLASGRWHARAQASSLRVLQRVAQPVPQPAAGVPAPDAASAQPALAPLLEPT